MHLKIETGNTFFEDQALDFKPMIEPDGRLKRWIFEMRAKGAIDVEG